MKKIFTMCDADCICTLCLKTKTFYKVTNSAETHHGFTYKDGLNVLNRPFEHPILMDWLRSPSLLGVAGIKYYK